MAYKGDTWFRIRGKKTYPRFLIRGAFEDANEHMKLWEKEIVSKLDQPERWTASINPFKTELSKYLINYKTDRKYPNGSLTIKMGLYRDGFHITVGSSLTVGMLHKDRFKLAKAIFGEINRNTLWTQEIAKVAPMANELLKRIEEYYK